MPSLTQGVYISNARHCNYGRTMIAHNCNPETYANRAFSPSDFGCEIRSVSILSSTELEQSDSGISLKFITKASII